MSEQDLKDERAALGQSVRDAHKRLAEIDEELARSKWSDLPQEDGWYLNASGEIVRREGGVWDDGWGNGGVDYGNPELDTPLTRLVPKV